MSLNKHKQGNIMIKLLIIPVLLVVLLGGQVRGIYKLTQCDFQAPYKAEIIYTIGIPTQLNIVLGWMNFGK